MQFGVLYAMSSFPVKWCKSKMFLAASVGTNVLLLEENNRHTRSKTWIERIYTHILFFGKKSYYRRKGREREREGRI